MGPRTSHRRRRRGSALVLGNYIATIGAVRVLADAGFHVILGLGTEFGTAQHSRHCHERFRHPPIDDVDRFVAALDAFLRSRPDVEVILPLLPPYLACIASSPERLPSGPVVAMADPTAVLTCLDKDRMLTLAGELGVPLRPSVVARDLDELMSVSATVGFPCVVKSSGDRYGPLPGRRKAIRCADEGVLRRELPAWPPGHPALVVQPWVAGPRSNVSFIARSGRIVMTFHSRTPRTDRLDGTGLGVQWDLVAPDARLATATEALVARLGYTGVGATQFLVPDDGEPHFLELNPRVGMPARVWAAFGFDMVAAACQLAGVDVGWSEEAGYVHPVGPHGSWTSREAYGLLTAIARRELGPRGAAARAWTMARSAVTADVHLTWARDDPLPTVRAWTSVVDPRSWMPSGALGRPVSEAPSRPP